MHDDDNHFVKIESALATVQVEYLQNAVNVIGAHFALNGFVHQDGYAACYSHRKYHNEDKLHLYDELKVLLTTAPSRLLQDASLDG
ncbi:hypothetical protein D9M71_414950 [compost metagenome]